MLLGSEAKIKLIKYSPSTIQKILKEIDFLNKFLISFTF